MSRATSASGTTSVLMVSPVARGPASTVVGADYSGVDQGLLDLVDALGGGDERLLRYLCCGGFCSAFAVSSMGRAY
ncbi:hypothetical protein [Nocardiopsis synnemataformans]|uniref:hypothetical protein n=1 Tax=Nocardiopsis synnemataformans TaxID=61305 RepID=UPI003EBD0758